MPFCACLRVTRRFGFFSGCLSKLGQLPKSSFRLVLGVYYSSLNNRAPERKETNGLKHYHLHGHGERSRVEVITNTGHTIATDVPKAMGGQNQAPQPVETLLAAFLGCTQATALFVGRQMRPDKVLIERMEFSISAYRDERGALQLPIEQVPSVPARLQAVTGKITVHTKSPMTDLQLKVLQEQTELRCPVASLLTSAGCRIEVCWKGSPVK